jgi:signal transduction histidine kinase
VTRRPLPLAVWAGALIGGSVLLALAVVAAGLGAAGALTAPARAALAAGALAGLCGSVVGVLLVSRVAAVLRSLRSDAVDRLRRPEGAAPTGTGRHLLPGAAELTELSSVLDALHARVRLGDHVGQRHREQAETAGAGVFELLSGLVAAEEGARGQLAAELHDTVAQSLMLARSLLADDLHAQDDVPRIRDLVEDAEEQVRAVMSRTRPPALREGDLAAAVANLCRDLHARYGLEVTLTWPPTAYPLPLASAITVYRFCQEALLNVVKHADVDDARLELAVTADAVRATVSDRGPGFDVGAAQPEGGRHVGLGLLRERARLSGGTLQVRSALGAGTTLDLVLPRLSAPATAVPALPEPVR